MGEFRRITLDDEDALANTNLIISKDPTDVSAQSALALYQLSEEQYDKGWDQYREWQLRAGRIRYDCFPVRRYRDREELGGKHVLVWLDRGLGDQIFEAGVLNELAEIAASVTVLCSPRLVPLFRRSFPKITFHKVGEKIPPRLVKYDYDFQMSFADLGKVFRSGPFTVTTPYLKPDINYISSFRRKYNKLARGRKVIGISWWSKNHDTGLSKSLKITDLAPLILTRGGSWSFVNLQYGDCREELAALKEHAGDEVYQDDSFDKMLDLDKAAAQIAAMDAVITSSNTVAHIAGALGVPTYVMLPRGLGRYWYWHRDREDSPWYPSLKLIRQTIPGLWGEVITRLQETSIEAREVTTQFGGFEIDTEVSDLKDALATFAIMSVAKNISIEYDFEGIPVVMAEELKRSALYSDESIYYRAAQLSRR